MVSSLSALYQYVIHVYLHVAPNLCFEDLVDKMLVGGFSIFQIEKYYLIAIQALVSHGSHMLFDVSFSQENIFHKKILY